MTLSLADTLGIRGNGSAAQLSLELDKNRRLTYPCNYVLMGPSEARITLQNGHLTDRFHYDGKHVLSIPQENGIFHIHCRIARCLSRKELCLFLIEQTAPIELREYFRINTTTEIAVANTIHQGNQGDPEKITGSTINLSASGVLASFSEYYHWLGKMHLTLFIPTNAKPPQFLARTVRKQQIHGKKYQVAFHFETISSGERDTLISYLLKEERKRLRSNIQVKSDTCSINSATLQKR